MHLMSASIVPSSTRFLIPASLPHCPTSPCQRHSLAPSRHFPRCTNKPRPWWQRLFSDDAAADHDWFDWGADYVQEPAVALDDPGKDEDAKFQAWKTRAEAISELREAQEDARNAQGREWEDWLEADSSASSPSEQDCDWGDTMESSTQMTGDDPEDARRDDSLVGAIKGLILGTYDDELLFEDRVFQFASRSSAKFIALVVLVPWALDFLVHDYMMMPFLDRYVKKVPLAAELLDVRRHQKLEMIKVLKVEKARFRLEVEIGKSPPLSDEEIWLELQQKAIELRDEWRLENRRAFANIWSDTVYGVALFALIYFNKSKVALLKFTGYKVLNNVSDTGKAFLIILITDIFLGYHSESGWQVLTEIILERYGLEVDQAAITIFICTVPVVVDACVKLWLFKFLPKLSPNVTNIFREMKRH
ncbi:putative chloroplast envelope membrane protein, CemA [Dioscorea sansibarensis]